MESQSRIELSTNESEDVFGISIPLNYKNSDSLDKINYSFIKYKGVRKIKEQNSLGEWIIVNKHFIEFVNFPKMIVKDICELVQNKLDDLNQKESVDEIIRSLINLFSKTKFSDRERKRFIGDFAEALFILKVKKDLNIDISDFYRSNENLFDFYIDTKNYFMEVKSCHKANGKIVIDKRQIEESDKRDFYVVEFQFIPGNMNILDVYKEINSSSITLKEKNEYWEYWSKKQEMQDIILKRDTVDFNKVMSYKLKNELVPKLNLVNGSAVEKIEITLNVCHSRSEKLDYLKKILN